MNDDDVDEQTPIIERYLLQRGWKRLWDSWWYLPLPGQATGHNGQRIFGVANAFSEARRTMRVIWPNDD